MKPLTTNRKDLMEGKKIQNTPEEQKVLDANKALWKQRHNMPDEDFETFISFPGHRNLALRTAEMRKYKIIAEVIKSKYCNAGLKVGQKFVFKVMPSVLLAEESDAPLCIKALGPMGDMMFGFWDRLSGGIDPNEGMWTHVQCMDPGIDKGGLGNVQFKVYAKKET